jgi:hypothetical protein
MKSFMIGKLRQILFQRVMFGAHGTIRGRKEVHAEFWWGSLKGRDHLEGIGLDGRL